MEELYHSIIGGIAIIGIIIGILTPLALIVLGMPGNNASLIPLKDLDNLFPGLDISINGISIGSLSENSTHYKLLSTKNISIPNTGTINIGVHIDNGYVVLEKNPVNNIVVKIYVKKYVNGGYNVDYDVSSNTVNIDLNNRYVKLAVGIPENLAINNFSLDMLNGVITIHVSNVRKFLSMKVDNGVVNADIQDLTAITTSLRMNNGVVNLKLGYEALPGSSRLNIVLNNGVLKSTIKVPGTTKLEIIPSITNSVSSITLNGKIIRQFYQDPGFSNSTSKLYCKITIMNGYANVEFTR
ncbi:MAG: hypothetical protein GXO43_01890 [Crenarchaeota archaeon]|nr:hypothetical protein [Thermoproteota archaeon]